MRVRARPALAALAPSVPAFVPAAAVLAVALAAALLATTPLGAQAPRLLAVPQVDLERYAGTWYEIARLPNRFQSQCVSDVTATYEPRDDGLVGVTNRCRVEPRGDAEPWEVAVGVARKLDDTGAKLEVSFLPEWLRWLPFGWGQYWVLELDRDYRHALVGEPERRNLWVLARTPELPEDELQAILARAGEMGFAVKRVERTRHTR